jgi:hypothetical protein
LNGRTNGRAGRTIEWPQFGRAIVVARRDETDRQCEGDMLRAYRQRPTDGRKTRNAELVGPNVRICDEPVDLCNEIIIGRSVLYLLGMAWRPLWRHIGLWSVPRGTWYAKLVRRRDRAGPACLANQPAYYILCSIQDAPESAARASTPHVGWAT